MSFMVAVCVIDCCEFDYLGRLWWMCCTSEDAETVCKVGDGRVDALYCTTYCNVSRTPSMRGRSRCHLVMCHEWPLP